MTLRPAAGVPAVDARTGWGVKSWPLTPRSR
jgi:hypothetical protein